MEQGARMINHSSSGYQCQRRPDLAEDGQTEDDQSINDHTNQAADHCASHRILAVQSTRGHVAKSQPQAYSNDDKHNEEAQIRDLKGERCAPRLNVHREQDGSGKPSSVQLPEFRDDRDNSIIHLGVIGTHEGKTLIPKRSVHRNALDDLAHPYDEEEEFYVLNVNLDGDQIDRLLHYSEIYTAGGEHTIFLPKIADCLLPHP
jgi:hypothetical protein